MNQVAHDMISFLQDYIRINTAMPGPDYEAVGRLFAKQAERDGLIYNRHLLPSSYPCFVITAPGTDSTLSSLILNHHMDVVPVFEPDAWVVDPFSASIIDNLLIGRGVQDTKGLGAVHYFALKEYVKRSTLQRTVHLLIMPDEECGGFKGTAHLIEQPFFKDLRVGFVFDEGPSSGDPQKLLVKVNERRPLQIRISVIGTAGHGSHMHIDNALHRLCRITDALVRYQERQQKSLHTDPGLVTSCNITHMSSGNSGTAYNVVSRNAYALVDIRISPDETCTELEAWLTMLCNAHGATYTVLASVPERPKSVKNVDFLYDSIASVVQQHGLACQSIVSEGASDLRFYWERNIPGIGFAPFTAVDNAHGINESLTLQELCKAQEIMHDCIHALNMIKD